MVRRVAQACGLRITAAGCPEPGRPGAAAAELGVDSVDDLRAALVRGEVSLYLLADPGAFGSETGDDAAAVLSAIERGGRVVSCVPVPASPFAATAWTTPGAGGVSPIDRVVLAPCAGAGALSELPEVIESFGAVEAASVEVLCGPADAPLSALLLHAIEVLEARFGEAELVDAALSGTEGERAARPELRGIGGHLSGMLRFPGGESASISLSDRGAKWRRTITLLGPGGRITVDSGGIRWLDARGGLLEEPSGRKAAASYAEAVSAAVQHALADKPGDSPGRRLNTLATAEAAMLSARTGQPERPAMIRRAKGG